LLFDNFVSGSNIDIHMVNYLLLNHLNSFLTFEEAQEIIQVDVLGKRVLIFMLKEVLKEAYGNVVVR
jgi:hypothetical protein